MDVSLTHQCVSPSPSPFLTPSLRINKQTLKRKEQAFQIISWVLIMNIAWMVDYSCATEMLAVTCT